MAHNSSTRLVALIVPGGQKPWALAGFACTQAGFAAGQVSVLFGERGVQRAAVLLDPPSSLDGAGLDGPATLVPGDLSAQHPNAVAGVDHVVVTTPEIARTQASLCDAGLDLRLEREATIGGHPARQAFFLAGSCVIELIGRPGPPEGQAEVWGVTFVTPQLEELPALDPAPVASIRDAVQPGRRIAVALPNLGLPTRVAFMNPREENEIA